MLGVELLGRWPWLDLLIVGLLGNMGDTGESLPSPPRWPAGNYVLACGMWWTVAGAEGQRELTSLSSCCCSVAKLGLTHCNPMSCSTPGFPVLHCFPEFAQTHVCWVGDAIQPSHCLLSPSPLAFNLSQHQGLFLMSQLFLSGGQNIGGSVSASVLAVNILGWFPLELTNLDLLPVHGVQAVQALNKSGLWNR